MKPMPFSMLFSMSVSSITYLLSFKPIVRVIAKPNPQISEVLVTSANDLDTGLILFVMMTARGTEIAMESTSPMFIKSKKKLEPIS